MTIWQDKADSMSYWTEASINWCLGLSLNISTDCYNYRLYGKLTCISFCHSSTNYVSWKKLILFVKSYFKHILPFWSPAEGLPLELVVWSDGLETRLALLFMLTYLQHVAGIYYFIVLSGLRRRVSVILYFRFYLMRMGWYQFYFRSTYINKILTNKCVRRRRER